MTFVAIYRGETVGEARLIGVCADPELVAYATDRMLAAEQRAALDPVVGAIDAGRTRALALISERRQ